MKLFSAILLLFLTFNAFGQKADEVLATANDQKFTVKDLSPEARQAFENLPKIVSERRQTLLEQEINEILLEKEAAAQKITIEKLIEREIKEKVPAPTDAEIRKIYDANRAAIGNRTFDEVRPQIIAFLRREPEQKAYANFAAQLRMKHKVTLGKNVNSPNLSRLEILAAVGERQISVEKFEAKNKVALSELEIHVYEDTRESLEQAVFSNLLTAEAKAQNIAANDLIAREITDKMRDYSDAEREKLEKDLREKLFKKYNAKILLKEITPIVFNVSTENQPARGKAGAPVTVVMFTDFQCPACAGVHPVLQQILAEYGENTRFVVRDFPLVQIHENAFQAALAANAAHAQNKFFEYAEILYQNQDKLDEASLLAYAARLNLDLKRFEADLKSKKFAPDVERDLADGRSFGISGTPTIFVNGVKVHTLSADGFRKAIERALKK